MFKALDSILFRCTFVMLRIVELSVLHTATNLVSLVTSASSLFTISACRLLASIFFIAFVSLSTSSCNLDCVAAHWVSNRDCDTALAVCCLVNSEIFELFVLKSACILVSFAAHRVSNCDCADVIFFSRVSSEPSLGSLFPRELVLVTIGSLFDSSFCAPGVTELLFLIRCAGTLGLSGAISHPTLFSEGGAALLFEF